MSNVDELFVQEYQAVRTIAQRRLLREYRSNTLTPTALVNEIYLKLNNAAFVSRDHFFGAVWRAMGQVLIDHARRAAASCRDAGPYRKADSALLGDLQPSAVEETLQVVGAVNRLAKIDERMATTVVFRYILGFTVAETAEALNVSNRTVNRQAKVARVWLQRELA